ncbi:MAG: crotonase/enoyl-CoA hydratase family protein [Acidimicrobiia bacterium]
MKDRIRVTIDEGVADVTLIRADKMNAVDGAMFEALLEAGEMIENDSSVRVVVLSGEGRSFCAGLDFSSFEQMEKGPSNAINSELSRTDRQPEARIGSRGQQAVYVWTDMAVPVIAAVHGHALGAGFQLALGADIRFIAPDAQMSVLEIRWGLVPDMTGTQMLPRLVGLDVAKELTFTGRMVPGTECVELGLATHVSDSPKQDAMALAREIAAKSPQAIRGGKRLLNMAGQVSLEEGFTQEATIMRSLIGSPNQVESIRAYFEKRPAVYQD